MEAYLPSWIDQEELFAWQNILTGVGLALVVLAVLTRKDVSLPGPLELPIVSNLLEIGEVLSDQMGFIIAYHNHFRDKETGASRTWTFKLPLFPRFIVLATRTDLYKHVLYDNFGNYPKGPFFQSRLRALLGDGIFNADGETWKVQRKTALMLFTRKILRDSMHPIFVHHSQQVLEVLRQAASSGAPLDIHDLFYRYTLDSIGHIAFGVELGTLQNPENPFSRAFDQVQRILNSRFTNPAFLLTEWWTGESSKLAESVKILQAFCRDLIAQRRKSGDYETREDVLSMFMRLKNEKGEFVVLHNDKLLQDIVLNFIIAGRDTTAQALTWTVYSLLQHPKCEERLVDELDDAKIAAHPPTYDQATTKLQYTRAVIREALRLNPSVPKDGKQAIRSDTLPDGTFVPAGSMVVYSPLLLCRETSVWGEDAAVFEPDRWIGRKEPDAFTYPVFNAGPRTCLGKDMALQEATTLVASIYRHFSFKKTPKAPPVQWGDSLTLPAKFPVLVNVIQKSGRK